MDPVIFAAIIGVLAAPFAALITWMLNRKKHIADIYTALSESSQTAVETMQLTMNELRTELEEARRKIDDLIEENELLRHDLHGLKRQNQDLMNEIRGLRASYEK